MPEEDILDCKAFLPMQRKIIDMMRESKIPSAKTSRLFLLWMADQQKEALISMGIPRAELEKFDNHIENQFKSWTDKTKPFVIKKLQGDFTLV